METEHMTDGDREVPLPDGVTNRQYWPEVPHRDGVTNRQYWPEVPHRDA
jgi:hypothetical protein